MYYRKGCDKMTLHEVCKILGKSETTLIASFKRTQENLRKKGILLTKTGIGKKADYQIIYEKDDKNESNS